MKQWNILFLAPRLCYENYAANEMLGRRQVSAQANKEAFPIPRIVHKHNLPFDKNAVLVKGSGETLALFRF